MSHGRVFDAETARRMERLYRTPEVVAQRSATLAALGLMAGESVLDIGAGPGLLAYDMAALVGREGRLVGVDSSADMVAMASARCADQPWAEFEVGDATRLPCEDAAFDAAVSSQVLEYVADIPKALAELWRVLKPGGRAVIVDTDYQSLVLASENPELTARILAAWDEHFVHRSLPQTLSAELRAAGFTIRQRHVIPMFSPEYNRHSFAYGLLATMASFVPGRRGVTAEEAAAWREELAEMGRRGRFFFNLDRFQFLAEKPAR